MYVLNSEPTNNEGKINYLISMMYLQNTAILPNITLGEFFYAFKNNLMKNINNLDRFNMTNLNYFSTKILPKDYINNEVSLYDLDLIIEATTIFYSTISIEVLKKEKDEINDILKISSMMKNLKEDDAFPLFIIYIKQKKVIEYLKDKDFNEYIDGINKYFSKVETYMILLLNIINEKGLIK